MTAGIENIAGYMEAVQDITQDKNQPPPKHLEFFGLSEEPFQLTPNRNFFFRAAGHVAVLEVVRYGIKQGEGFIIVIGEVGTGKTLLLRMLMAEFAGKYETALILSPLLSPKELVQAILSDIEIEFVPDSGHSMESLLRELNAYLYKLAGIQKRLAVIIDEAQNLPDETIEQLRLLSNFESDSRKQMQIVLVGQPELKEKLNQPNLRQLLQRVTIIETLPPLSLKEVNEYVSYRMSLAGRTGMKLPGNVQRYLYRQTMGIPRRINRLMGRALLVAYSRHSPEISRSILKDANDSLLLEQSPDLYRPHLGWILAAGALLMITAVFFFFFMLDSDIAATIIRGFADLLQGR